MKCDKCGSTSVIKDGDEAKCLVCGKRMPLEAAPAPGPVSTRLDADVASLMLLLERDAGVVPRTKLARFYELSDERIDAAVEKLVLEGKIKIWPTLHSAIYTRPDATDPRISDPKNQKNPGNWKRGPKADPTEKNDHANYPQNIPEVNNVTPESAAAAAAVPWSNTSKVLSFIERHAPVMASVLTQRLKLKADDFRIIIRTLEEQQKIKGWKKGKGIYYTLYNAPSPFENWSQPKPAPSKASRAKVARIGAASEKSSLPAAASGLAPSTEEAKPEAPASKTPEPPFELKANPPDPSPITDAIAELRRRRTALDFAIAVLEAVA